MQSLQDFRLDALIMIGPDIENPALAGAGAVGHGRLAGRGQRGRLRTHLRCRGDAFGCRSPRWSVAIGASPTSMAGPPARCRRRAVRRFMRAMRAHGLAADARVLTGGPYPVRGLHGGAHDRADDPQLPSSCHRVQRRVLAHSVRRGVHARGTFVFRKIFLICRRRDNSLVSGAAARPADDHQPGTC